MRRAKIASMIWPSDVLEVDDRPPPGSRPPAACANRRPCGRRQRRSRAASVSSAHFSGPPAMPTTRRIEGADELRRASTAFLTEPTARRRQTVPPSHPAAACRCRDPDPAVSPVIPRTAEKKLGETPARSRRIPRGTGSSRSCSTRERSSRSTRSGRWTSRPSPYWGCLDSPHGPFPGRASSRRSRPAAGTRAWSVIQARLVGSSEDPLVRTQGRRRRRCRCSSSSLAARRDQGARTASADVGSRSAHRGALAKRIRRLVTGNVPTISPGGEKWS